MTTITIRPKDLEATALAASKEQIQSHLLSAKQAMRAAQELLENSDDPYDAMDNIMYAIEDLMEGFKQ